MTSVFGAIPAEIFQGRHYGTIFGTLSAASMMGGAMGPWVTGALYDATGTYTIAFCVAIGCSAVGVVHLAGRAATDTGGGWTHCPAARCLA